MVLIGHRFWRRARVGMQLDFQYAQRSQRHTNQATNIGFAARARPNVMTNVAVTVVSRSCMALRGQEANCGIVGFWW